MLWTLINKIIEETGVKIDIEEDGQVFIYGENSEKAYDALYMIEDIVREIEVGGIYYGAVIRTTSFGAFVDLGNGKEGLVHISQISDEHIRRVEDYLKLGQKVTVKVTSIDQQGRINMTMKKLNKLEGEEESEQTEAEIEAQDNKIEE